MKLQKALGMTLVSLLLTSSASADIIPLFGSREPKRWIIELHSARTPSDMTIIHLDENERERVLENDKGGGVITITNPGTLYIAASKQLSKPFSPKDDMPKLIPLKTFVKNDFPIYVGVPRPECACGSIIKSNNTYVLNYTKNEISEGFSCKPCVKKK